ncbi:D-alanyl-D-alanine carboxypeptidase/D-alanyl-D-alanine-endopeptidase [Salinimicrobium sp. CAU 1759]
MYQILRRSSIFLSLLLLLSCATGKDLERELEKSFSQTENSLPWFKGMMVYEPATKKVIFEHNSHKYFTPASTIKLYSFYTGIKLLKDSIPGLKYAISKDTLYFSGTGDPTFLHKDFDSSNILSFLKSAPETIVFVSPEASEEAFGPGWAWDDYNYGFSAERSTFPIYGNVVSFEISPESLTVVPANFGNRLQPDTTGTLKRIRRNQKINSFEIPLFGTSAFQQNVPFMTSPELTAELLSDTLQRKVILAKKLPKDLKLNQQIMSQPTDSIYKKVLQNSDNLFAEQLLLMAAGEISDTLKTEIVIDHMKQEFLQEMPDDLQWVDGSGLSRYNLTTPGNMVWLLERIYEEVEQERLFHLLPAGGVSGTIKSDYPAPAAKPPFIFAKTGTMKNNHSLSGYLVTASGKVLIFSFMNSNYLVPTAEIKARMDHVLRTLYLNY